MAAKGRKPAITGIARPEGIIDDVVIPLGRKAVKKVTGRGASKAKKGPKVSKANIRSEIRAKQFETISKVPASVRGYTDEELMKKLARTKPYVTRQAVRNRNKAR